MSSNAASAAPTPGGYGLWVKVIIVVALVIAGYAYIWSLVHSGSDQAATNGVKPLAVTLLPKAGPPPTRIPAAPSPASEAQPKAPETVSFGPGTPTQNLAASMPEAATVAAGAKTTAPGSVAVMEPKPGAGAAVSEPAPAAAASAQGAAPDAGAAHGASGVAQSEAVARTTSVPGAATEAVTVSPSLPEAPPAAPAQTSVSAVATKEPAVAVGAEESVPALPPAAGLAATPKAVSEPMPAETAVDPSSEAGPADVEPVSTGADTSEAPAVEPAVESDTVADATPPAAASRPAEPGTVGAPGEGFRPYNYRPRLPDLMYELRQLGAEARADRPPAPPGYGPGYGYPGHYPGAGGGRAYGPAYYPYPYGPPPTRPAAAAPARPPQ